MQVLELVKSLRISTVILGISNLVVGILGGFLVLVVFRDCDSQSFSMSVAVVSLAAAVKIFAMVCTGIAQKATAIAILDSPAQSTVADNVDRLRRRMSYKTWRGWSHFAMIVTLLQTISAFFLLFYVVEHISEDGRSYECSEATKSRKQALFPMKFSLDCSPTLE